MRKKDSTGKSWENKVQNQTHKDSKYIYNRVYGRIIKKGIIKIEQEDLEKNKTECLNIKKFIILERKNSMEWFGSRIQPTEE